MRFSWIEELIKEAKVRKFILKTGPQSRYASLSGSIRPTIFNSQKALENRASLKNQSPGYFEVPGASHT